MADPKKAGENANRLITELNQAAAVVEPTVSEDQGVSATAITDDQGDANSQPDVGVQQARTEPSVSPELDLLRKEVSTSEQRWKVLQGMVSKKDEEINQLRILLSQVSQKSDDTPASAPVVDKNVTKQEVDEFGQELIDLIAKIASSTAQGMIASAMAQNNAQMTKVEQHLRTVGDTVAKSSADMFDEALTKRVPDWATINEDPAFIASLQTVDDLSGVRKIDLLTDAYTKMDLPRTARFFELFKGATQKPAESTQPAVPDVNKLLSPGKSKAANTLPAESAKTWRKSDIARLYEDKRAGRITQEEFAREESDLFKAQRENRLAA